MLEAEHIFVTKLIKILFNTFYQQIQFQSSALHQEEFHTEKVKVPPVLSE